MTDEPDYTPAENDVRAVYAESGGWNVSASEAEFDRWLVNHTRAAKVSILRYAADWITLSDIGRHGNNDPIQDAEADASVWLEALAARIESADA